MAVPESILRTLFTPISIRSMKLNNRIVMPPITTLFANADGLPTDRLTDYLEARARGGAALVYVEATVVHRHGHMGIGERGVCAIYDDSAIPRWRQLTGRIHAGGAKVCMQLYHPGRQMTTVDTTTPLVAPSAVPCPVRRRVPRALSIAEIEELVQAFAQAALRVREAGFDAVEIDGAHGYLIAQFMSAHSNKRTDRYGGDLMGRLRFPLEILRAVRRRIGPDFPIIFRYSAIEGIPGGCDLEEAVAIAPLLVDAGADCLSISTGTHANLHTRLIPPMGMPKGLNVEAATAVKRVVDVPVMVAGRLNDPLMAAQVIAAGKADLVAIGRGLVADPELPNKTASGQLDNIRWCISCNECISRMETALGLTCLVNPEVGREREMELEHAAKAKRVLVAGGGPAGLEAARVAALRGHKVTLYEKEQELGGQFRLASIPPYKHEVTLFLGYLLRQVEKAGVEVVLGEPVSAALVEEMRPDAVIVATGGRPRIPNIPGIDAQHVVTAHDVLAGKAAVGQKVLIAGGGMVGCETADFLAEYGRDITIVEMLPELARDVPAGPRELLLQRLERERVRTITSATIKKILDDGVVLDRHGEVETMGAVDTIVLALGVTPVTELADELRETISELYVIGDAKAPARASEAIAAGAESGRQI